jgi:ferredoxin-NADP reductase/MOSC domain-containing protein YiiM/ferredoxin
MARLISINVGLPRNTQWRGATVFTGIRKQAVNDRRMARRLNIDGDGQGDLAGHGGEHRAVMVYQIESYKYWEVFLGRTEIAFGQFGENFTVEGLPDDKVCIGDCYRIGAALFEVTQPRVTCYRVGIGMNEPQMPSLLVSHHRPGFYFRVIEEGEVGAGDEIVKVADGPERMTVAEIDALLYLPGRSRQNLLASLRIPALSEGWKGSFRDLLQGGADSGSPAWSGFRGLRVSELQQESAEVVSFSFAQQDGTRLPASRPGQHVVLKLQIKPDEPPVLRSYSLSGAPDGAVYRISVKREEQGIASSFIHRSVKAGDTLEVSAPTGDFTLEAADTPVVLASAGIGVTPVLAMLHSLAATGSLREVWWLHGARDGEHHPFAGESRELLTRLPRARSHIGYSRPRAADRQGTDYDFPGRLDSSWLDRLCVPHDADFYLCGPSEFLAAFDAGLRQRGIALARIHKEVFGPGESMTPGISQAARPAPHPPTAVLAPGAGPAVSFTRSGLTVPWNPSFGSLLELAEASDVPVKWSCLMGVCHTCESALIGGAVEYRPDPLEMPPNGKVLICCSRPKGRDELELDL